MSSGSLARIPRAWPRATAALRPMPRSWEASSPALLLIQQIALPSAPFSETLSNSLGL